VLREHQHTEGRNLIKGLNTFLSVGTLSTFIVGFEIIYKKYADYGLDGPGSNLGGYDTFRPFHTGPGVHPASCTMGTRSFPGVEVAGAWG